MIRRCPKCNGKFHCSCKQRGALTEAGMVGSDWLRPTARPITVDAGCPASVSASIERKGKE